MTSILSVPVLARAAVVLLCAKLAVATLYFDSSAYLPYSHVKSLVGYGISFVLLGVVVALVVIGGRAVLVWHPMHVPAIAFAAAYVVAAAVALNTRVALTGADGRFLGLYTILDAVFVYAVAALVLPLARGLVRWIAVTLAVIVAVELAVELLQAAHVISGRTKADRPVGTTGNPDPLGVLMASLAAGALGIAAAPRSETPPRVIAVGVAFLALVGWLVSGTRAPIVGLAATVVGLAVLWAFSAPWPSPRIGRIGGLALLLVAGAAVVMVSPMGERVLRIAGSVEPLLAGDIERVDKNVAGRLDHYRASLDQWYDRPVFGVGPDNYAVAWPTYRLPGTRLFHRSFGVQTSDHSWFFKLVTDAGVAGLVPYLAILVLGTGLALRRWRDPWVLGPLATLACYLAGAVVTPNSTVTEWIPWLSLGLIVAAAAPGPAPRDERPANSTDRPDRRGRRSGRRRGRSAASRVPPARLAGAVAAVAVGLLLALTPSAAWGAARAAAVARVDLRAGRDAMPAAQRSVDADPQQPAYWNQLGLALRRAGREADALAAFERAAALAPFDVAFLGNVSQSQILLAGKGDAAMRAAAIETARRAVGIDPYRPEVHFGLALALYDDDRFEEAAKETEEGRRLDEKGNAVPDYGYEVAARSYLKLERPADAERWSVRGLEAKGLAKARQVTLHVLLAQALVDQERRAEALEQVNAALALDPDNDAAKQLRRTLQQTR